MLLSRRVSWFLIAFGLWSWIIWPTFLKNIWADPRSWHNGPTGFFTVHLLLTVTSIVLGTVIATIGLRALRAGVRTASVSTAKDWEFSESHS